MTSVPIATQSQVSFDIIQTFYADKKAVSNSPQVSFTSVELYFKNQPHKTKNNSGINSPGVSVWLCEVSGGQPIPARRIAGSLVRKAYNEILVLADASSATKFDFEDPITIPTEATYGICVQFEDNSYKLWTNKTGDKVVGTNKASPGDTSVANHILYFGPGTSSSSVGASVSAASTKTSKLTKSTTEDLKYGINVAKYISNSTSANVYNKDYEFMTTTKASGSVIFKGGEHVYKNTTNATGTLLVTAGISSITGNNTLMDTYDIEGKSIVIYNHVSSKFEVFTLGVTDNTHITVFPAPTFTNATGTTFKVTPTATVLRARNLKKSLILSESTATNTSFRFVTGDTIIGSTSGAQYTIDSIDNLSMDRFKPSFNIKTTSLNTVTVQTAFSWYNGSAWQLSGLKKLQNQVPVELTSQQYRLLSRSSEVATSTLFDPSGKKKSTYSMITITKPSNNPYVAPVIPKGEIDLEITKRLISSNASHYETVGGVVYDKEIYNNGNTETKYISKKIPFANNRFSEDVKVFLTAYRPENTDVKVYCRVHNSSDPNGFDSKAWTPLICTVNSDQYSAVNNKNSLIEYTYNLPQYSETANTLPGTFTTQLSNNIIFANESTTNPSSYVVANDAVKVYSPLFPNNYQIGIVTSSNSTAVVIGELVSNNNIVGTGFKVDKLKYPDIAFNNPLNDNICRYFNNDQAEFDKFDTMQVKIVLTAEDTNIAPEVTQYQFIGVSA